MSIHIEIGDVTQAAESTHAAVHDGGARAYIRASDPGLSVQVHVSRPQAQQMVDTLSRWLGCDVLAMQVELDLLKDYADTLERELALLHRQADAVT